MRKHNQTVLKSVQKSTQTEDACCTSSGSSSSALEQACIFSAAFGLQGIVLTAAAGALKMIEIIGSHWILSNDQVCCFALSLLQLFEVLCGAAGQDLQLFMKLYFQFVPLSSHSKHGVEHVWLSIQFTHDEAQRQANTVNQKLLEWHDNNSRPLANSKVVYSLRINELDDSPELHNRTVCDSCNQIVPPEK